MSTHTKPIQSQLAHDPEMSELLDLFLSELPKRVDSVTSAWRQRELNTLRRIAHQMKGSCAGYGFPTLGQAAADVERTVDQNAPLETIATEVNELVELCQRALQGRGRAAA
ncbi:MAG TPA: Hpt domain-containing protein [Phycisphaerales bacterium]|nr:Hpt domain-containing protein [Phycisphaerales bacterium]